MKVIILKDIDKMGRQGEVVEVKDGYARNYLIPMKLALVANKDNMGRLEKIKKDRSLAEEKGRNNALRDKEKIDNISITLSEEAKDDDELYGSINEVHIARALKGEGIEIERRKIRIDTPIKKLGVYNVKIELYAGIEANLRVWVVKK